MEGALGTIQLKKLANFVKNRKENALYLQDRLTEFKTNLNLQKDLYSSSWFGFGFTISEESKIDRNTLVGFLSDMGIESRPIVAGNFTKNPVVKLLNFEIKGDLACANYIHEKGFFIGNHHFPIETEIDYFVEKIVEFGVNHR
jgi:CDP-6-deoxy-D-xylo-4-hexulose-3-dehydrase